MERISVPVYEPCGQCANGNVLRNGRTEKCPCWVAWWQSVRQSILGPVAPLDPEGAAYSGDAEERKSKIERAWTRWALGTIALPQRATR
jgi:hypothetical protein